MSREPVRQVREQRPCNRIDMECSWVEDGEECPAPGEHCVDWAEEMVGNPRCVGCNGDGMRWVVVGTLQEVPGIGSRRSDGTVKYVYGECEMDWSCVDNLPDWAVELFAIVPPEEQS